MFQDQLPAKVREMYLMAKSKKEAMNIVEDVMTKKGTRWQVDVSNPRFQEKNISEDRDLNKYRHMGRSRLLVEQVTPGGVVASLMSLRLSVS